MAVSCTPQEKLIEVRRKSFRDQAIWFLNSSEAGNDLDACELVRSIEQKCSSSMQTSSHEQQEFVVDEFTGLRLLEFSNKPCTSNELRKFMDATNQSHGRRISLAELLIYQFGYDWQKVVSKPDCRDLLAERDARDELENAKAELNKLTEAAKKAAQAAEDAHKSEIKALDRELAASKAAENAQAAKVSLDETSGKARDALESLNLQESSTRRKKEELERIAYDGNNGIVMRNKAKAELAILKSDDPITLRTARIQQEAAVKKMTIAAKRAEETVAASETALERAAHARKEAVRLKESCLAATKEAEAAIPSAQAAFDKISETLEEIMKKEKTGKGSIYFIQSDLNQSRKYLPKSRFIVAQRRASKAIELAGPLSPPKRSTIT